MFMKRSVRMRPTWEVEVVGSRRGVRAGSVEAFLER
jgi:hypothetical protein